MNGSVSSSNSFLHFKSSSGPVYTMERGPIEALARSLFVSVHYGIRFKGLNLPSGKCNEVTWEWNVLLEVVHQGTSLLIVIRDTCWETSSDYRERRANVEGDWCLHGWGVLAGEYGAAVDGLALGDYV